MYAALWRALPGPVPVKALILVVVAGVILWALAYHVFPWVSNTVFPQDVTVEEW